MYYLHIILFLATKLELLYKIIYFHIDAKKVTLVTLS